MLSGGQPASAADRVALFSSALPGLDAAEIVAAATAHGFRMVEWGAGPGQALADVGAGAALRGLCDAAGLEICGVSVQDPDATLAAPGRAAAYMALAVALGAPHIRYFAQKYRGAPFAAQQERARAGLRRLVELAEPAGIRVLIETSPQTIAPSPDLILSLTEEHGPKRVGVLYDPGNMVMEGHLAPQLALDRLGPYLQHVHVKNQAWFRKAGVWHMSYAPLEHGILDWREILTALAMSSYTGALAIDHLSGAPTLCNLAAESNVLRRLVRSTALDADLSRIGAEAAV